MEPLDQLPAPDQPQDDSQRRTLLEQFNISPIAFGILTLLVIFILYQVVGGLLTLGLFGFKLEAKSVTGFRVATGIGQLWFILLPTLIFAQFATLKAREFLRVKMPNIAAILFALVGIFALQEVLSVVLVLQDKIPIPDSIERMIEPLKRAMEEMQRMLVGASSLPELMFVLLIVAVIPAVCEEFMFRGLVQRLFEKGLGGWPGVVLTGIIFGAYHFNPFAFIPLAGLGVYLGFVSMRSGSIWVSVAAHGFNNALAVIAVYFHMDEDTFALGDPAQIPMATLLGATLGFAGLFAASTYVFWKITEPKRAEPQPDQSFLNS